MAVMLETMKNGEFMKWLLAITVVVAAVGSRDLAEVITPQREANPLEQRLGEMERKLADLAEKCGR